MKRIVYITLPLALIACIAMIQACKKDNQYPSHVATVSFPVVTLIGPQDTTIYRGATWVDPGATWRDTVTGESGTLRATATVNTSIDSAYYLVYTATNKNGFQTIVNRGLGVTNYNGPINISGIYTDSYGGTDTLYKVSRALYYHSDADATADLFQNPYNGDPGVVVIKSDSTISVATLYNIPTGTVGVPIPITFSQASIIYQPAFTYTGTPPHLTAQPPVIFSYTVSVQNVNPYSVTFTHN